MKIKCKAFFCVKIYIVFSVLFLTYELSAQSIIVGGSDWNVSVPPINEAGTNYVGTYESIDNQILISAAIPGILGLLRTETVQVHYEENPVWNNSLLLNIRRTSSGGGGGICVLCSITGGTTYQPITKIATNFFNLNIPVGLGTKTFTNIPVQLQLTGVSVTLPADYYNARIVFTITN